ncbi:MAG: COX15/CtaA family protein [candidate division Zixibacteria bacterium]|nr:COX15/CtaA family protein [candidate division Zixibacteria bacterium]
MPTFEKTETIRASEAAPKGEVRIAGWLLFLTLLVFVLILWGGVVRLSGSGLSIPDWPLINGSLLPPMSDAEWQAVFTKFQASSELGLVPLSLEEFKTLFWIEYAHRFLAALVGIVFLAVFVRGFKNIFLRRQVGAHLIFAAMLLIGQALLGGLVVKQELKGELVAAHLGTAFWFFGVLLWTTLKLSRMAGAIIERSGRRWLILLAWAATFLVFVQVVSGGLAAGSRAGLVFNTFPKMGDFWIPPGNVLWSPVYQPGWNNLFQNQILIQFFHRWWAFIAAGFVIWAHIMALKVSTTPRARLAARGAAVFVFLQIILGIGNLMMKAPLGMSLAHLVTGLSLFALLVILTYELRFRYETQTLPREAPVP